MKLRRVFNVISLCLISVNLAYATTPSLVNSDSCTQLRGSSAPFILALKKGENLNQSILQCANDADLAGASVSGLGAIENPTLHYYDDKTEQNVTRYFPGLFELVSLNGNVFFAKGKREVHLHAGLSGHDYHMFGGNVDNATVGVLAEVTIVPLQGPLIRKQDKQSGFDVLSAS
ncbi:MAG: DUF296 domain-containing protein [Gammaproteobacteria bacterium]|nr:DUF296 domain-containing protein [Gammaproteobacteria bacterium]